MWFIGKLDDEEILNNIERAEELNELLSEYNMNSVDELRAVIFPTQGTERIV